MIRVLNRGGDEHGLQRSSRAGIEEP